MDDVLTVPAVLALALGLGFFLGLAFEEHYAEDHVRRPGGIRTFPMLALAGAVLWLLEPAHGTAFLVLLGFVAVAMLLNWRAWMGLQRAGEVRPRGGLMVPVVNLAAAAIGPACLTQPPWIPVGLTMAAVLLLRIRISLHGLAARSGARDHHRCAVRGARRRGAAARAARADRDLAAADAVPGLARRGRDERHLLGNLTAPASRLVGPWAADRRRGRWALLLD